MQRKKEKVANGKTSCALAYCIEKGRNEQKNLIFLTPNPKLGEKKKKMASNISDFSLEVIDPFQWRSRPPHPLRTN
jgi:hypothetical protein